jgi:hypothetical protein
MKAARGVANVLLSLVWEPRLVARRMFVTVSNYKSFLYGVSHFFPVLSGSNYGTHSVGGAPNLV